MASGRAALEEALVAIGIGGAEVNLTRQGTLEPEISPLKVSISPASGAVADDGRARGLFFQAGTATRASGWV